MPWKWIYMHFLGQAQNKFAGIQNSCHWALINMQDKKVGCNITNALFLYIPFAYKIFH